MKLKKVRITIAAKHYHKMRYEIAKDVLSSLIANTEDNDVKEAKSRTNLAFYCHLMAKDLLKELGFRPDSSEPTQTEHEEGVYEPVYDQVDSKIELKKEVKKNLRRRALGLADRPPHIPKKAQKEKASEPSKEVSRKPAFDTLTKIDQDESTETNHSLEEIRQNKNKVLHNLDKLKELDGVDLEEEEELSDPDASIHEFDYKNKKKKSS